MRWAKAQAFGVEAAPSLLFDLLLHTFERSPKEHAWADLYSRVTKWLVDKLVTLEFRVSLSALSSVHVGYVARLVSRIERDEPEFRESLLSGMASPEERRVFVALAVRALLGR